MDTPSLIVMAIVLLLYYQFFRRCQGEEETSKDKGKIRDKKKGGQNDRPFYYILRLEIVGQISADYPWSLWFVVAQCIRILQRIAKSHDSTIKIHVKFL